MVRSGDRFDKRFIAIVFNFHSFSGADIWLASVGTGAKPSVSFFVKTERMRGTLDLQEEDGMGNAQQKFICGGLDAGELKPSESLAKSESEIEREVEQTTQRRKRQIEFLI